MKRIEPVIPEDVTRMSNALFRGDDVEATSAPQTVFQSAGVCECEPGKCACAITGKAMSFICPPPQRKKCVLDSATDWKMQFDVRPFGTHCDAPFPPEIATLSGEGSRPDAVIWSMETKTIIWIELTSPWEDNMTSNHYLKKYRYNQLAIDLRTAKYQGVNWIVHPLEVEVGSRGVINETPWNWAWSTVLGFTPAERKHLTWAAQESAFLCSLSIFLARFSKWDERQVLNAYDWIPGRSSHISTVCGAK